MFNIINIINFDIFLYTLCSNQNTSENSLYLENQHLLDLYRTYFQDHIFRNSLLFEKIQKYYELNTIYWLQYSLNHILINKCKNKHDWYLIEENIAHIRKIQDITVNRIIIYKFLYLIEEMYNYVTEINQDFVNFKTEFSMLQNQIQSYKSTENQKEEYVMLNKTLQQVSEIIYSDHFLFKSKSSINIEYNKNIDINHLEPKHKFIKRQICELPNFNLVYDKFLKKDETILYLKAKQKKLKKHLTILVASIGAVLGLIAFTNDDKPEQSQLDREDDDDDQ